MTEKRVGATVEYDDDFKKAIHDIKDAAETRVGKLEGDFKTLGEKNEEGMKRMEEIARALKEQKPRSFGFPQRDIRALKFEPTQKGFDRFLAAETPVSQKGNELGILADEMRSASDDLYLAMTIWSAMASRGEMRSKLPSGPKVKVGDGQEMVLCKGSGIYQRYEAVMGELMKALDTATANEGAEWIPTGFSSQLYRLVVEELRVASQFTQIEMPTDPWKWPFQTARPVATKHSEATGTANPYDSLTPEAYAAGTPTDASTWETVKMRALQLTSRELSDDSIIAILPFLQSSIVQALAEGRETCTLNGDDTATHMDDDVDGLAATDIRKSWKGLRRIAIDKSTDVDINTFDTDAMHDIFKLGGVHLRRPDRTFIVTGQAGYWQLMGNTDVLTVDKYGPNAVVQAGELGRFENRPIIISDFFPENLAATGVNTAGGPNTFTGILAVRAPSFFYGHRPGLGVETERLKVSDQFLILAFDRVVMKNPEPAAAKPVAYGINLGL